MFDGSAGRELCDGAVDSDGSLFRTESSLVSELWEEELSSSAIGLVILAFGMELIWKDWNFCGMGSSNSCTSARGLLALLGFLCLLLEDAPFMLRASGARLFCALDF